MQDLLLKRLTVLGLALSLLSLGGWSWAQPAQPPNPSPAGGAAPTAPGSVDDTTEDSPADEGASDWRERWLYNPQERTRRALDAYENGRSAGAEEALQSAMRLQDGSALSQYNAGTVALRSNPSMALPLLQGAADGAAEELSPDAHYNLGNAQLEAQDYQAAIESYKSALRRQPSLDSAKFNLELAQKLLQEQQENQQNQEQEPNPDSQDQQDQDQQQNQDQQDQNQDQQNQDQQDQEQDQEQQQGSEDQQNQDPQEEQDQQQNQDQQDSEQNPGEEQERPLPQFRDLPDMTAEEAAAMLEAIENLEREQRRQEALEAAKAQSGRKKDW